MAKNTDIELLKILEEDARIPTDEIATMLGISGPDVEKRINDMKSDKVIRRFKTSIDWKVAGVQRALAIIQVKVVPQERDGFSKTCKAIAKDSRVKDIFVATGEYDLIILVEAKDIDEISEFITDKLAPKKEVTGTNTHIVLREFKRDGVISSTEQGRRLKVSF